MSQTYSTLRMFVGSNVVALQPDVVGVDMLETLSIDLDKGTVEVAALPGLDVYRVTRTEIVAGSSKRLDSSEARLVQLLHEGLDPDGVGKSLYFSYGGDLTLTTQRNADMLADSATASQPVWARADPRFFWNRQLSRPLTGANAGRFVLTLILGFVAQEEVTAGSSTVSVALIARRSVERAGVRHWRRGADRQGRPANFVETEQIVIVDNGRVLAAHVQLRGSIPLLWTQIPNIKYKPPTKIAPKEESSPVFQKHMQQVVEQYKTVTAVNLVSHKGSEGKLEAAFRQEVERFKAVSNALTYVAFDFHHQCGASNWGRLSILWDQVKNDFEVHGFFLAENGEVVSRQGGVMRTNCIDCLDRTNVVQGVIGRKALEAALRSAGVLSQQQEVASALPQLDQKYKVMFADHGDAISQQYAGTGALKSGFTRTGKRTLGGKIDDGVKSIARYYINNFLDGRRQDAFDLVTGNFSLKDARHPLFRRTSSATVPLLGALLSFCWAMMQLAAVIRSPGPAPLTQALQGVVLPLALAGGLVGLVVQYGRQLVDRPQLCPHLANTLLPAPK